MTIIRMAWAQKLDQVLRPPLAHSSPRPPPLPPSSSVFHCRRGRWAAPIASLRLAESLA
jgi:hypothetical protein